MHHSYTLSTIATQYIFFDTKGYILYCLTRIHYVSLHHTKQNNKTGAAMNERLFNLIETGNLNVTLDVKWVLEWMCEEVLNTSDLEYAVLTAENELFKTQFKEAFLALEINDDMLKVLNVEFVELAA